MAIRVKSQTIAAWIGAADTAADLTRTSVRSTDFRLA
jgi:hypothetical protein